MFSFVIFIRVPNYYISPNSLIESLKDNNQLSFWDSFFIFVAFGFILDYN